MVQKNADCCERAHSSFDMACESGTRKSKLLTDGCTVAGFISRKATVVHRKSVWFSRDKMIATALADEQVYVTIQLPGYVHIEVDENLSTELYKSHCNVAL